MQTAAVALSHGRLSGLGAPFSIGRLRSSARSLMRFLMIDISSPLVSNRRAAPLAFEAPCIGGETRGAALLRGMLSRWRALPHRTKGRYAGGETPAGEKSPKVADGAPRPEGVQTPFRSCDDRRAARVLVECTGGTGWRSVAFGIMGSVYAGVGEGAWEQLGGGPAPQRAFAP